MDDLTNKNDLLTNQENTIEDVELPPSWVRIFIVSLLAITLLTTSVAIVVILYQNNYLAILARDHAQAMIGVPWAGGAAFIVVLVLRTSFGAINFKILGVEFKGASGPIIMWVLCFLVEVSAIKLLW
jgi:hypothetical protein